MSVQYLYSFNNAKYIYFNNNVCITLQCVTLLSVLPQYAVHSDSHEYRTKLIFSQWNLSKCRRRCKHRVSYTSCYIR